jgi:hypothetical protein
MGKKTRRQFLTLTALAASAAALPAAPAPDEKPAAPKFSLRCKKPDDAITASVEQDRVVFRIISLSGISEGEITLVEGTWPRNVVLHFAEWAEYMEDFHVNNGAVGLHGRLRSGEDRSVWLYDRKGAEVKDREKAFHTMTIEQNRTRFKKDRVIEIVLPPGYCSSATKTLKLHWLDAFRG